MIFRAERAMTRKDSRFLPANGNATYAKNQGDATDAAAVRQSRFAAERRSS